jgi:predicted dinucleotide-binding enzyme
MTTAIIGAGSIRSVLAANLARGREDVVLASRSPGRAQAVADHVGARAATAGDVVGTADIVIFTMWFDVAKELLARYRDALTILPARLQRPLLGRLAWARSDQESRSATV